MTDLIAAGATEALGEAELVSLLKEAAEARNAVELIIAAGSAEVARLSTREAGYDGLAQRLGHRNATSLVQNITGQSRADVTRTLRTGEELAVLDATPDAAGGANADSPGDAESEGVSPESDGAPVFDPGRWLKLLGAALRDGRVGQAQYQAIRHGLGEPPVDRYPDLDPEFLPSAWAKAVETLLGEAATTPLEELRAAARTARDRLDPVGVTLRFEERFAARSFRMWIDEHGQRHARIVFDDDAAAWVDAILQAALRPRRGPRFVDPADKAAAAEIAADERSNEQLQYDTILAVLRTGGAADPNQAFGDRQPGVRIVVTADTLTGHDHGAGDAASTGPGIPPAPATPDTAAGSPGDAPHPGTTGVPAPATRVTGVGHLEDGGHALPGGVIEKYLCDAGAITITLDTFGRPLDVGREKRLFTRKQRIAIAVREGGCIGEHCTAPISQVAIHHINHWEEHHGRTDTDDGIPLCRNCHLRLHNHGARITRTRDPHTGHDTYWWHNPPDPHTGTTPAPIPLRTRTPRRFAAA